ncbi:hypothetical protein ORJ00_07570 [Rheinheimera baltica]|uniref:hypothetical protein n=1 Tax=Rheinheimera baltica TaxID=67576 RepID=UPI00273F0602|nr:hypothetical protein [Rheinheimera baltica]MDP5142596.1 hypothetical protein [Rheinheimera baltica]MDP5151905.1 hypothetical protein [Rheinheimera baltica]
MSVLNKMLRDLEQRQQTPPGITTPVISSDTDRPLWLTLLLALSVMLLCFAVYAILSRSQPTVAAAPAEVSITAEQPDTAVMPVSIAAAVDTQPQKTETETEAEAQLAAVSATLGTATVTTSTTASADATHSMAAVSTSQISTPTESVMSDKQINLADKPVTEDIPLQLTPAQPQAPTQPPDPKPITAKASAQDQREVVNTVSVGVQVERKAATPEQRAAALRQQALAAAGAGQLQQALQYWQQVQQLTPADPGVYIAQARLWTQLGQPSQAELTLRQALSHNIINADIQLLLAQYAATNAAWQQVVELLPAQFLLAQQPDYYGLKATALQQLGQQQAALQWFVQLIQLQPQQARWWLGAAIAHDALAQREQAHLHYQQALNWGDGLSVASRDYIQQRLAATE